MPFSSLPRPNSRYPFLIDFLSTTKKPEISTPYDPVHLTHVGFNSSTGEFTGLPKEWQQLLQESGISRLEQERNPQAVMEIVKFYQEGHGEVWDKMGHVHGEMDDALARKMNEAKISTPDLTKGPVHSVRAGCWLLLILPKTLTCDFYVRSAPPHLLQQRKGQLPLY